ncbi:MAG: FAD-binding oxidoreductase [Chthoniobacteraceae bacterium]
MATGRTSGNGLGAMGIVANAGRRVGTTARAAGLVVSMCVVLTTGRAHAQTPEEHASHHPGEAAPAAGVMPALPGAAPAMSGMSGMSGMGDTGKMMEGMGKPPPKELYPSLMALPELTPQQRKQVEEQAEQRMHAGSVLIGQALDLLNAGTQSNDYAAMHEAMTRLREGAAQLESGIAARRALAEGRAPREVALAWFKREMNLSASAAPAAHRGVTPFHLFTMALLIAFALAMVAMYFFKMRRAAALFGRIDPDKAPPPPGSSPPLAGGTPPNDRPPGEGTSPPGGKPPPTAGRASEKTGTPSEGSAAPSTNASSATPVAANWRGHLRVASIVTEAPGVKTFRLVAASGEHYLPFTFVPGQFLNVAFGIGGARMNRSYSISSSPTQREYVELTIKREPRGAVSRHIDDLLKVGDVIEAGGPVGKFTFDGTEADSIVLISAGVGITPMVSISRYLTDRGWPGDIYFIHTCRTLTDYILEKEIAALEARNAKLHVTVTLSKPEGTEWEGPRGRITKELLTKTVPELAKRRVHICGPAAMMDATKALLLELGVPPEQMKMELFGATKPAITPAGTTAEPAGPASGPTVTFSKNNKAAKIHEGQTVLELSEELAIGIENSCRIGTCGVCKVKMNSGEVTMAVDDALDADDKANGIILACQAIPKTDIDVAA